MKEALKKARASYISANKELVNAMAEVVAAKGEEGFTFGEYNHPVATDNLEFPIEEPLMPHEITALRVKDDELEAKVVDHDEWYPLSFDPGMETLVASEELVSACLLLALEG